ncbi:coiled-coil domain-containing protein 83 [Carassius gibelio]|uniref:coiled-coil domain-containing protein 83 n=1 Tax=Carassius gibelio TaxID=101364 RepID=UPI0022791FEC|nr:coiled-coil domain-containing protein 83 [Carassius gibelio]
MSKALDTTSLSEAFIQFQIQVKREEIQDFEEEISQLEDKKNKLIKLQEQLREEHKGYVRDLQKKMKEQERNLEQRQREDEEQVECTARENLELKHKQQKELEELRCKLARLQVQVKELQEEQHVWLQYKNDGSIKDQQKIQKLEKDIALTQRTFQEISEYFQRSLVAAINETEQKVAQSLKDGINLAFERAKENLDDMSKLEIKEMHWLKKQVPLYNEKVAVLESTVQKLEEEILDLVSLSPGNEFLEQSASLGSHDTHNMDRNIMKISPEETSELVNRVRYPLQPLTEVKGAQQKSNVTASGSTTTSTPPNFSEIFSDHTDFTGPTHLGSLEQKLLWVRGKAYPLHPLPNDPADMGEEMTFDLLQTESWPVTTNIIHRKFKPSSSQSGEADESLNDTCEIQLLDKNFILDGE